MDVEHRTACRRFVARLVSANPHLFARGKANTIAAGVAWAIGQGNQTLSTGPGTYVKDLVAHMGVASNSPSQRGVGLLWTAGFPQRPYGPIELPSPDLLVSARRRRLIDRRT